MNAAYWAMVMICGSSNEESVPMRRISAGSSTYTTAPPEPAILPVLEAIAPLPLADSEMLGVAVPARPIAGLEPALLVSALLVELTGLGLAAVGGMLLTTQCVPAVEFSKTEGTPKPRPF